MAKVKTFKTIFPAVSVPLNDDYSINEEEFRVYLRWIKSFYDQGIQGLVCNGHTGEITGLTRAERKRVTEICAEECGDGWIPLHWTYVDGLYPISANLESDDFAVVTSIPIFLVGNWNTVNDANSPFTLGNPTGTAWSLVYDNGYITISGTEATVDQSASGNPSNSEFLVATLNGNVSKKFYVCDFEIIPDLYIENLTTPEDRHLCQGKNIAHCKT